nr:Type 1 glutamine amidotransferase-like domain-containing protein [Nakamurella antarctica]
MRGSKRGWLIANALDGVDDDRRLADVESQIQNLSSIGLTAENFDLRNFTPDDVEAAFGHPDFVWVRGGNVFILRMAMARSAFDRLIVARLAADDLVYAGFSAGACVLAPSLLGLELCDSVVDCRAEYGDVRFAGLAVLDRAVVPHLQSSDHPETNILGAIAKRYDAKDIRYWPLRDGQALVVDGFSSLIQS